MARFIRRQPTNLRFPWRFLLLFVAVKYMLDSAEDILVALPVMQHNNRRNRFDKNRRRNREAEINFLRYRRAMELHHYALLHIIAAEGMPINREVWS